MPPNLRPGLAQPVDLHAQHVKLQHVEDRVDAGIGAEIVAGGERQRGRVEIGREPVIRHGKINFIGAAFFQVTDRLGKAHADAFMVAVVDVYAHGHFFNVVFGVNRDAELDGFVVGVDTFGRVELSTLMMRASLVAQELSG